MAYEICGGVRLLRVSIRAGILAEADVKYEINIAGELGNLVRGKIGLG